MSDFETLLVDDLGGGVVKVTLNRPQAMNAISTTMITELRDFFAPLAYGPGDLRCVVVTGSGDKAFCVGGDLKERRTMDDAQWRRQHAIIEEATYNIVTCSVPVIAAVNGYAYAGGFEFALGCDFIYAAEHASFALTEVKIGIMPGGGGTQTLARAVGERRAKEIILSATPFSAAEAKEWGIVNRVCAADRLLDEAIDTAKRIATNAPISVRQAKKSIHYGLQTDIRTGLLLEAQAYDRMISTEDRYEGVNAFNEKRSPNFKGV